MQINEALPIQRIANFDRPPGPRSNNPLLGLLAYRRGRLDFLLSLAQRYGDICYFEMGSQKVYLLNHPDFIKEVLVDNSQNFIKGPALQRAKLLLGEGLLTAEGETHRSHRRLAQPAFHRSRIEAYAKVMNEYTARRIADWRDGQTIDLAEEMMALTLAIVGKTLFDADMEHEAAEIGAAITDMLKATDTSSISSVLSDLMKKLPVVRSRSAAKAKAKFENAKATLDKLILRIIDERKKSGADRGDLLSMLILASDEEDGSQLSSSQLRDEAMTIFMTGHETTAVTIAWAFYLLSANPEAEAKLHAEIDKVLMGRTPSIGDLGNLPYTDMIISECMRLYPPAWALQRTALKDCYIGKYRVPKGAMVLMSQYVTHRDPRYFPDPERFDPERWTESRNNRPQFSFYPFGGGPRRCIGDMFALMETKLLLIGLAQKWQMRVRSDQKIGLQPVMSLRPKYGMRVVLRSRQL